MDLMTAVYETTNSFPESERFGLTNQLRRCSVSIPSNIAEGFGRRSTGDFLRFLNISMGSLFELQTQLEASYRLQILDKTNFKKLYQDSREIERMISSFIKTLK